METVKELGKNLDLQNQTKASEVILDNSPYLFPRYGHKSNLAAISETHSLSENCLERIKSIGNGNHLGELSVILSGVLAFLQQCQTEDRLQITIPVGIKDNFLFIKRNQPQSSLKEFVLDVQQELSRALSSTTKHAGENLMSTVGFGSDQIYVSSGDQTHNLFIQFKENSTLEIRFKPAILGEKFALYLVEGIEIFVAGLRDSSACVKEIDLLPTITYQDHKPSSTLEEIPVFTEQFRQTAAKFPNEVAIIQDGFEWTYVQIEEKSNQLAHHIKDQYAIQAEDSVAVILENSAEAYITFLSILKAGATYVPIDPDWPEARIEESLQQADIRLILTHSSHLEKLKYEGPIFACDFQLAMLTESTDPTHIALKPSQRAYIIFTSGTTGKPRGVEIEHGALANMLYDQKKFMQLTVGDRFAHVFSPTFDASLLCMGVTLLSGATLLPLTQNMLNTAKLSELFEKYSVNATSFVPSVLRSLDPSVLKNVKLLICGGEKLLHSDIVKYGSNKRFVNSYGTTETTCCVCTCHISSNQLTPESIVAGAPIKDMTVLILNENGEPSLPGLIGEVWITGPNLARGYLNAPDATHTVFVQHQNQRSYKTGDLGRLTPEGKLEISGRCDRQIKINGQRIEPIEIESVLVHHPKLNAAHVEIFSTDNDGHFLVAFTASESTLTADELQKFVAHHLPQTWVPSHFITLETLPNNSNGKVDQNALRKIWLEREHENAILDDGAETSVREAEVIAIWRTIFSDHKIDRSSNFFLLGGHSLLAIQLLAEIERKFGVAVALGTFLSSPTIPFLGKEIDLLLENKQTELSLKKAPIRDFYPITASQKGFWIQDQLSDKPFENYITRCFAINGELNQQKFEKAVNTIFEMHEAFSMNFELTDTGEPMASFSKKEKLTLNVFSATEAPISNQIQQEFQRIFDLKKDRLIRISLMKSKETSYLVMTFHHIICDGWAVAIFLDELQKRYNEEEVAPLEFGLKDCLYSWYGKEAQTDSKREEWVNKLEPYHNKELIRSDFDGAAATGTKHYQKLELNVPEGIKEKITLRVREKNTSVFTFLATVLAKLLHLESGENSIRIGTPVAGRSHPELRNQIGCFIDLIPLQFDFQPDSTFEEMLNIVNQDLLWGLDRSEAGFSNIVEAMGTQPKTSRQRHPLFDIEIDYRAANINADPDKLQLNGIQTEKFEKGKPNAGKFDFDFLFTERENEISLEVYYKSNLYKRETAERLLNNFMTIVSEVLENPTLKMNESASKLDNSSPGNTLEEKRRSRLLKAKLKSGPNNISPEIRNPEFEGETLADRLARDASDLKNDLAVKKIILYRGFPLESEAEFQNAVGALGDRPFTYIEKSSLRKQLKEGVYTSTEHPKEQEIHLHCEHSYSAQWPLRLIFACLIPAPQGGATTLADAQAVVDALPEASIERFKREGVLYVRNFGGKLGMNWPQVFLTEDKAEVEQYCAAHGIKFEWWGDNNLRTFSKRPAFRKHPVTGELLWFNHSFFFNPRSLDDDLYRDLTAHCDKDRLPFNTYYGDGQEIEAEIFSKMKSALNQTKTPHYWEQGDFLLIDNLQIAHGRMPFEGDRKIVLAMTQMNTDHLKLSGVNF